MVDGACSRPCMLCESSRHEEASLGGGIKRAHCFQCINCPYCTVSSPALVQFVPPFLIRLIRAPHSRSAALSLHLVHLRWRTLLFYACFRSFISCVMYKQRKIHHSLPQGRQRSDVRSTRRRCRLNRTAQATNAFLSAPHGQYVAS